MATIPASSGSDSVGPGSIISALANRCLSARLGRDSESWDVCQITLSAARQRAMGATTAAASASRRPSQRLQTSQNRNGYITKRLMPAGRIVIARPQASAASAIHRHVGRWAESAMAPIIRHSSEMNKDSVRM